MLSNACSASIIAHMPPFFCASAITWIAIVVLPEDSGPYISMILPLGNPPTPRAESRPIEPVDITSIASCDFSFIIITLPFPKILVDLVHGELQCFEFFLLVFDIAFLYLMG